MGVQLMMMMLVTLTYKDRSTQQEIYVNEGLTRNLLGLPAITELQIIARLDAVSDVRSTIMESYPKLFTGLGNFGNPHEINLKKDAVPFALNTPRRIPLALRDQVKAELQRMENLGVISPVEEATEWCAGMVVVPKRQGNIRVCVDLKVLNESVQRETFPLPRVDEVLAQLSGATTFSKLDANSGFWQIPLADQSRSLNTFIIPYGRFQFGITCAPELFQRRKSQILSGLEGVLCLIDDVLVFGRSAEEHDKRLRAVLRRLEAANVTLNADKYSFQRSSIQFLGHIVDSHGISVMVSQQTQEKQKRSEPCPHLPTPQGLRVQAHAHARIFACLLGTCISETTADIAGNQTSMPEDQRELYTMQTTSAKVSRRQRHKGG